MATTTITNVWSRKTLTAADIGTWPCVSPFSTKVAVGDTASLYTVSASNRADFIESATLLVNHSDGDRAWFQPLGGNLAGSRLVAGSTGTLNVDIDGGRNVVITGLA